MKYALFKSNKLGFTLLELLVVAAIVVVIAVFAIPAYTSYITQSRVSAFWEQAEAAKLAVESMYLKQNATVSSITVNSGTTEYTTPTADYIQCITIQGGNISVVGVPTQFNNQTVWISWIPNTASGTLTWSCTYSSDTAQYISNNPGNCSIATATYTADSACT